MCCACNWTGAQSVWLSKIHFREPKLQTTQFAKGVWALKSALASLEGQAPSVLKITTVKSCPCPLACRNCSAVAFHDLPLASWKEGSNITHFALLTVQLTRSLSHLWRYKRTLGFGRTGSDTKLFAFIKEDLPAIFKTAALQVTATAFEEFFGRSVSDELFICKYCLLVLFNSHQNSQNVTQVVFQLQDFSRVPKQCF